MTQRLGPPTQILAVLEGSDDLVALQTAAALADHHGAGLEVFSCLEPPRDIALLARMADRSPDDLLDELSARRKDAVARLIGTALPGRAVAQHFRVGKTFVEVIRHVIATGTDFVVKTAAPLTGPHRFLFTSTDQHLLRKCPCPVWLQTQAARPAPGHVLAAVDVDDWDAAEPDTLFSLNCRVLDAARQIAAPTGAKVTVLHAWEAMGEGLVWSFSSKGDARIASDTYVNEVMGARQRAMRLLLEEMAGDAAGARMAPLLVRGSPERVIEDQSRALGADVVVMGTVARTGLSGVFIGNTAENIINTLDCPVLAVKPDGFVSPLDAR